MAATIEFNFNDLKKKLNLVHLPPDREWFKLIVDEHSYVAFLNVENGITKRKVTIRDTLKVEIYLREKACPWPQVDKPVKIMDVNLILYNINKI